MKKNLLTLLAFEFSFAAVLTAAPVIQPRNSHKAPRITSTIKTNNTANDNKYSEDDIYKKTVLITENFDKFTQGAVDSPSAEAVEDYAGKIPSTYTLTPGWTGLEVFQAGGAAYIGYNAEYESTGSLNTPNLDFSKVDVPVTVTLRARCETGKSDFVCVDILRDDQGEISYFTNDYATLKDEWTTFSFTFNKQRDPNANYYIQFYGYYEPIYVDDIEVKYLEPYMEAPKVLPFSNFGLDGFTANWEKVEGATKYIVSVFEMQDKQRTYVLQDVEVDGLSMVLTGLDTSKVYYYTVRAFDGQHYSPESELEKVESLIAPVLNEPWMMEDNSLYINWNEVPNAGYYELQSFINHTSENEEVYTISNEKFDRISVGSQYTIYAPFADLPLEEELKDLADQSGWISSGAVRIDGAYGLDGYGYEYYRKPIYLESPELDLSNNGGQFSINVDLLGVEGTRALARVLHVEGLKMVVDDKFEINDLTEEWKNYTIDLKNGTDKSYVEICCYGPSYMYIDNLNITQKLNAGDNILVPFVAGAIKNSCDTTIAIPEAAMKDNITYKVRAVKEVWDDYGYSLDHYVYSDFAVGSFDCNTTTSIENVSECNDIRVVANGNQITIDNKNSEDVAVYNACGTLICQNNSGNKNITLNMPCKGVYIVKVGNRTIKMSI